MGYVYRYYPGPTTTTATSDREYERVKKVERLEANLIARGVSKWTAKAWAEAEVPPAHIDLLATPAANSRDTAG